MTCAPSDDECSDTDIELCCGSESQRWRADNVIIAPRSKGVTRYDIARQDQDGIKTWGQFDDELIENVFTITLNGAAVGGAKSDNL
jgi:hypothetical protein